jgi:hypothetical protein
MTAWRMRNGFRGGLLVVGGQCRNVGKTALVVDLIRAFPRARWTAVKITPYVEAGCPVRGAQCDCGPNQHTYAILEESDRSGRSDTSRFLEAGAERALWVWTKERRVAEALVPLADELAKAGNVIVESDAIVKFWKPDLFLMVLDPRKDDCKASARAGMRRADAFVCRSRNQSARRAKGRAGGRARVGSPKVKGKSEGKANAMAANRGAFFQPLGRPFPKNLQEFVVRHLVPGRHPIQGGR